jgi:hypothetical protein
LAGLDFHQLDSFERFHRLTSNSPFPSFAWRYESLIRIWAFDEIHKYSRWRNWLKGVVDEHHSSRCSDA